MPEKPSARLGRISLHPLAPEEAIRHALNAGPLPAAYVNGKHPKPANKKPKKRVKKK
jgi:hypothetical protein